MPHVVMIIHTPRAYADILSVCLGRRTGKRDLFGETQPKQHQLHRTHGPTPETRSSKRDLKRCLNVCSLIDWGTAMGVCFLSWRAICPTKSSLSFRVFLLDEIIYPKWPFSVHLFFLKLNYRFFVINSCSRPKEN